jgi:tetratricopeptide (TPR) repeat protein
MTRDTPRLLALVLALGLMLPPAPAHAAEVAVEVGDIEVAETARETVIQARTALDAGRFEDAASLFGALAEGGGGAPARTAQAVALYEIGDLHAAKKAADTAVRLAPADPAALNILGVVLVDSGSVREGIERLDDARKRAHRADRKATETRALVNLALARVDLGEATAALIDLDDAEEIAKDAGDLGLSAAVASARTAAHALAGTDSGVGALLGKGQVGRARKAGEAALAAAKTRRQRIVATRDVAAVDRAEGRLDDAARKLADATSRAREAGLVREQIAALVDLGLVQGLAGRSGPAADTLRAAARLAKDAGYRVLEVDARRTAAVERVTAAEEAVTAARAGHDRAVAQTAERGQHVERLEAETAGHRGGAASESARRARRRRAAQGGGPHRDRSRARGWTGRTRARDARRPDRADRG